MEFTGIRTGNKAGSRPLDATKQELGGMPDSLGCHLTSGVARVQAQQMASSRPLNALHDQMLSCQSCSTLMDE